MRKAIIETIVFNTLLCGALFASAGSLAWPMGWVCVGFFVALGVAGLVVLPPDLLAERSRLPPEARPLDVLFASLGFIFLYLVSLIVCGLDFRWAWSPPVAGVIRWLSFALLALGYAVSLWAARSNPFFSTVVRIQSERGHHVVDRGSYAVVRHPGYAGPLIGHLVLPLGLGSLWGVLPAAVGVVFMALRAVFEERTLAAELEGYREYMQRVRWRLIPHIW